MNLRLGALAIATIALCSCARETRVVNTPQPPVKFRTGVEHTMMRQVMNAADAGEGDLRIRTLRQRVAAEPANAELRIELGKHYETAGLPELAADHYRAAIEHNPSRPDLAVRLAKALRKLGLDRDALAALESHPNKNADVYSWMGIIVDALGDLQKAEAHYRSALAMDAKSDLLHNNLGYNLLLQMRHQEAAAEFRAALAIAPGSTIARNNLGLALAADPKDAVLHWQSVSDPATAHSNLAAVLIEEGKYQEARKELSVALGYNKDHSAALSNLRLLSELDGQPAQVEVHSTRSGLRRAAGGVIRVLFGEDEKK
jgi:tetratricopeptide (TPR) repeat protein